MDSLFPILIIAAILVLASINKRTKSKRPGPIPVPPRRKPLPKTARRAKIETELAAKEAKEEKATAAPKKTAAIYREAPAQVAAAAATEEKGQHQVLSVPRRKAPPAWSTLSPKTRELYNGFIWSELWQPPLAKRRQR